MTEYAGVGNWKRILAVGIAFVLFVLILEMFIYNIFKSEHKTAKQVSIIVSGAQADRWENLKLGTEQAAAGTKTEINLITMSVDAQAEEQIAMIGREITNGADALIIEAADSRMIQDYFASVACEIPVIYLYSGPVDTDAVCYVSTDNYEMGAALAEELISQEKKWIKAAIVLDDVSKECITERFNGVYEALVGNVDEVVIWEKDALTSESELKLFLQEKMIEEAVDVAIALDTQRTEALIDATENLNKSIKIYGIGNSDKIVHYLDQGLVRAVAYQNDFSAGYMCMNLILDKKAYRQSRKNVVEYKIVNKEKMYTKEYERMIFPFVK